MSDEARVIAEGRRRRERAQGPCAADLQRLLESLSPELADMTDSVIFGRFWDRSGLTHEEQMLIAITALVMRDNTTQLRNYLYGALQDGIPAKKIHDAMVMCAVYGGFPVTVNGVALLAEVCDGLRRKGIEFVS